jgi:hypothetical protein
MKSIFAIVMLILVTGLFTSVSAQEEGRFFMAGLKDQDVEQFFTAFKKAIVERDKQKVASMVHYPVKAKLASGGWRRISSSTSFVRFYDRIFDQRFTELLSKLEVKDLWGKSAGVTTPRGEVWFSAIVTRRRKSGQYPIKIIAINGPIE